MEGRLFAVTVFCLCLASNGVSADRMHKMPVRANRKQQCIGLECDQLYWQSKADDELQRALLNKLNENVAKNVILFLGDGMSIPTVTASRIYDGQNKGGKGEENSLVFDKFPHVALSKTYNVDHQVADSASTGTAYLCGSKTNTGVIGFDGRVLRGKCSGITNQTVVDSIAKLSQEQGKRTGIFANNHVPYEYQKRQYNLDIPTLAEMTEAAITILRQGKEGFFLLVEGGRIDHGHHDNYARRAVDETVAMNEAVAKALEMTDEQETLIIVTADHSHTMTINGYPERGNPITGVAGKGDDNIDFTTLTYADGLGSKYYVENGEVVRPNPSDEDTSDYDYRQQAAIPLSSETHGGDDVGIFANGPMAHLFHSVHEENYIATVMAYASCVDKEKKHCKK